MVQSEILAEFDRAIRGWFVGIATMDTVEVEDDKVIDGEDYVYGVDDHKRRVVVEKVHKFNRKALLRKKKSTVEKVDSRFKGGDDTMILQVGRPGSRERVEALAEQYAAIVASGEEVSPFSWEG